MAFRWLLVPILATSLGTGIQLTAIAWLALDGTGGGFTVGLVLAARMLPNLLSELPAGILADRVNRRRLLFVARLASILLPLGLT